MSRCLPSMTAIASNAAASHVASAAPSEIQSVMTPFVSRSWIRRRGGKMLQRPSSFGRWVESPVGRLLMPFFLTSIVGFFLTASWEVKRWNDQQRELREEAERVARQQSLDETLQLIYGNTAAARDIVTII